MTSTMPLLSVYWPYLLTSVLVYVIYVLIFGRNRNTPGKQTDNTIKLKSSSKEVKTDKYSSKDDVEEFEEGAVQPLTFPEDTPHIPYIFNAISAVRSMFIRATQFLCIALLISYIKYYKN